MAFNAANFTEITPHTNPNIPKLWIYKTDDNVSAVAGNGYFNSIAKIKLKSLDIIYVTGSASSNVKTLNIITVNVDEATNEVTTLINMPVAAPSASPTPSPINPSSPPSN